MVDRTVIADIEPALELTFGPGSLTCNGRLNAHTRPYVLEAIEVLLDRNPGNVEIDVSTLHVADADGANALVAVQRSIGDATVPLRWRGLDAEHVMAPRRRHEGDPPGATR